MDNDEIAFSDDLLRGADEIARFMFGDAKYRRKVYHLAATSTLPVFKIGAMLCCRKSVLIEWIRAQEGRHTKKQRKTG